MNSYRWITGSRATRSLWSLPVVLMLAACQAPDDRSVAAADTATSAAATTQAESVIRGTASYRERVKMPPGASLRVQLIDNRLADTPQAVVAEATMEDIAGPPIPFNLKYDPARLRDGGDYGLHASLYGTEGELWFVTETRVPVTPGAGTPIALALVRVPAGGKASVDTSENTSHWQCSDLRVTSAYDPDGESVTLSMSGRNLKLPIATSASGARYADTQGNEFWTKGRGGTLTLAGEQQRECMQSDQASPWHEAAARGVVFRAVGGEPGWFVEVGPGEAPTLRATLDYGERMIEVANAARLDGAAPGYRGSTADGVAVVLTIRRERCADGMSGEGFEASAKLSVGDAIYQGCGAFLTD